VPKRVRLSPGPMVSDRLEILFLLWGLMVSSISLMRRTNQMTDMFKRKFDGPLQQPGVRRPIENPELFHTLVLSCQMLLITAIEAPGHSHAEMMAAVQEKRHVEGAEVSGGKLEKALKIADQLIEMEPLRAVPWMLRAQALTGLGRVAEALASVDRAIEIDPSDPAKWRAKCALLRATGDNGEAEQAEKRAKELDE
jgi:tetratricopeptide (TPR) repeat protein